MIYLQLCSYSNANGHHGGSAVVSVHPPAASTGHVCGSCSRQTVVLGGLAHRSGESLLRKKT